MNKLILFGLLALIINSVYAVFPFKNCSDYEMSDIDQELKELAGEDFDGDVCKLFKTNDDYTHCCYIKKSTNVSLNTHCVQIKDDYYENIKNFKKYVRDENEDGDLEIDCSNKFVSISLFAVLALLF